MSINDFSEFYSSVVATVLGPACRWTISGRIHEDSKGKAPLDVRHFLSTGRIRGAWARDEQCLVTLDDLTRRLPEAANCAYYLEAVTDGVVVVDIEPSCPPEVSSQLLQMPNVLYSETSMSGRGYHLVLALPSNFHDFEVARTKKVLREEHGWYELLLEHWVTFTRRPIDEATWDRVRTTDEPEAELASLEAVYGSLARKARASSAVSTEVGTTAEAPEIAGADEIVARTLEGASDRIKEPGDFNHDMSRWEFSVLGVLHHEMRRHAVIVGFLHRTDYTDSDRAWLLYQAAAEVLPGRPKHREQRNGRPYLLDRAAAMVAASKLTTTNDAEEAAA